MTVKAPFFLFLSALVSLFATLGSADAHAAARLTNVSIERAGERAGSGTAIDLTFDRPVSARGLKAEYERNFMQLVFRGTKIDGAKIVQAAGGAAASDSGRFQKVFAYAYSPDTARVRFIFGAQRAPQGKISFWNKNARTIRVLVRETGISAPVKPVKAAEAAKSSEEKELIKEVMSNTHEIDIHNPDSIKAAFSSSGVDKTKTADSPAAAAPGPVGVKSEPSKYFVRMALSLLGIIGLFLGCVLLVRRYSNNIKKLPFGKKERIIQVIATHYLGNKKNISLVKVAGDYLVVGVGNEGISLISRLGNEVNVDKYLEDRFWGGTFEKHLGAFTKTPKAKDIGEFADGASNAAPKASVPSKSNHDGARDVAAEPDSGLGTAAEAVTDRVELSSIRTSIREKLTKLKPLA